MGSLGKSSLIVMYLCRDDAIHNQEMKTVINKELLNSIYLTINTYPTR